MFITPSEIFIVKTIGLHEVIFLYNTVNLDFSALSIVYNYLSVDTSEVIESHGKLGLLI